jgi:hypothetical protein
MGVLIGFATKLGSELSGVSTRRNLSWSLILPTITTRVVGIPQMVFTNPITTTHVHRTTNQPLMSLVVARGYRSANIVYPRGWHQEPFTVITPILDHRDGHYVRPNIVAFKYPNFKKNVDPNVHVKIFNFAIKENVENFEKYIINAFNYMLRDSTLD